MLHVDIQQTLAHISHYTGLHRIVGYPDTALDLFEQVEQPRRIGVEPLPRHHEHIEMRQPVPAKKEPIESGQVIRVLFAQNRAQQVQILADVLPGIVGIKVIRIVFRPAENDVVPAKHPVHIRDRMRRSKKLGGSPGFDIGQRPAAEIEITPVVT